MTTKQVNIDFITTENIEMIWDIFLDDIKDGFKTQHQFSRARSYFINQAKYFFERENLEQQELMQLNKKFISQIMQNFDNDNTQNQNQNSHPSQQNNPVFRAEDIQAERRSAFEKGLAEKRNDFNSAMSVPVPETPNFSDGNLDKPIGGAMEELIARTLAQRNFEIETFSKPINKESVENWLKPTETSVKSEKAIHKTQGNIQMEEKQKQYQYTHQSSPKFINIGEELPIVPRNKKQISWGKNQEYEMSEINLEVTEIDYNHNRGDLAPTLFSKLKYIKEESPASPLLTETTPITSPDLTLINERISNLENKLTEILDLLKNKN